jgi:hypothetical protein
MQVINMKLDAAVLLLPLYLLDQELLKQSHLPIHWLMI